LKLDALALTTSVYHYGMWLGFHLEKHIKRTSNWFESGVFDDPGLPLPHKTDTITNAKDRARDKTNIDDQGTNQEKWDRITAALSNEANDPGTFTEPTCHASYVIPDPQYDSWEVPASPEFEYWNGTGWSAHSGDAVQPYKVRVRFSQRARKAWHNQTHFDDDTDPCNVAPTNPDE